MSLAYNPPLAGHLGLEKTLAQIMDWFYWPGIHAQVHQYCTTYRECQLNQEKGSWGGGESPLSYASGISPF